MDTYELLKSYDMDGVITLTDEGWQRMQEERKINQELEELQKLIAENENRDFELQILKGMYECENDDKVKNEMNSIEENIVRREHFNRLDKNELILIATSLGNIKNCIKNDLINYILKFENKKTLIIIEKYYNNLLESRDEIDEYQKLVEKFIEIDEIEVRRHHFKKLDKNELILIATSLGNIKNCKKNDLIDYILEFENREALIIIEKYYNNNNDEYQKIVEIYNEIDSIDVRRNQLKKLSVKNELIPIAKYLGNTKNCNKNFLIDYILEFESDKALYIIKKYYNNLLDSIKLKKLNRCREYHKIVELYTEIGFKILSKNQSRLKKQCKNCKGMKFEEEEFELICDDCGLIIDKPLFSYIK